MKLYKATFADDEEEKKINEVFIVPSQKVFEIEKVVKRLEKKGLKAFIEKLGSVQIPVYPASHGVAGNVPIGYIDGTKVRVVSDTFKINDYQLVAKIDHRHDDEGNPANMVFRIGNNDIPIPKEYFEAKPECDYCHIKRFRNTTYVLYNEKTKEYIHVGSECLKYFTEGLNANAVAEAMQMIEHIEDMDLNEGGVPEDELGGNHYFKSFPTEDIIAIAYEIISKQKGYKSTASGQDSTAFEVRMDYLKNEGTADYSHNDDFIDFVNGKNGYDEYWLNVKQIISDSYVDDKYVGILVSAVYIYWKDEQKKKELENSSSNSYLGEVGDKVAFVVKDYRELWTSQFGSRYATPSTTYRIVTYTGQIVIWSTAASFDIGNTIVATIKQLKEYKGEKETVVTRGSVTQ